MFAALTTFLNQLRRHLRHIPRTDLITPLSVSDTVRAIFLLGNTLMRHISERNIITAIFPLGKLYKKEVQS